MNIIACVKQTPVTAEVELTIDKHEKGIETESLVYEMNEWDEYAIEEALLIKEKFGGTVTIVTMGPDGSDAVIRRCLAKGADIGIWLKDEAFEGSDAYATAKILHAAIKSLEFDLILTGAQASDMGYGAVGVFLASFLDVPYASMVKKVEVKESLLRVNRELEGGLEEIIELEFPALLTIQTGINEPRYVSIMGIRRARRKEINIMTLNDIGLEEAEVGRAGSWINVEKIYRPPVDKETEFVSGSPELVSERLVEILKARGLV